MKHTKNIKLMLLGIAFITYGAYSMQFMPYNNDYFAGTTLFIGSLTPIIGMIICIIGYFSNNNEK